MSYHFSVQLEGSMDDVIQRVTEALMAEGFGILTEIDVQATLKKKLDVDFIFQSFYNARQKPGGIHPKIMPLTAQARAATNHFYMSLTNSSSPSSWPCHFITPDGLVSGIIQKDRPGILLSEVCLADKFYDASRHFRENAMEGKLSSGDAPDGPAYSNRKSL